MAKESKRKTELTEILGTLDPNTAATLQPLVDEICYLENKLKELRKLPSYEVSDKGKTRITAAGKQYKEYFQSYTNALKVVQSALLKFSLEGETEFEKWVRENAENNDLS